jgi:hypothetical protein
MSVLDEKPPWAHMIHRGFILISMTGKEKGDIYIQATAKIEVTAWAVLTVFR